jgi:hypothetical protein
LATVDLGAHLWGVAGGDTGYGAHRASFDSFAHN